MKLETDHHLEFYKRLAYSQSFITDIDSIDFKNPADREKLIKSMIGYIMKLAKKYKGSGHFVGSIIMGICGLMEAIDNIEDKWQKHRRLTATSFRTYAYYVIWHEIQNYLKSQDFPLNYSNPHHLKERKYYIKQYWYDLQDPIVEKMTVNRREEIYEDYEYSVLAKSIVQRSLKILDSRERKVITWRYALKGDFKTLKEIGKIFNLSRERVRQIQLKAEAKIKRYIEKRGKNV